VPGSGQIPTVVGFTVAVRKWSVSIDEDLAGRVEEHVSGRGLSSFVSRAVEHELERDILAQYLDELDAELGPVPEILIEEYDRLWP
jgi:hypothetical protein